MPVWISKRLALAIHAEQVAEHGGPSGLRDEGLLESALARPHNLMAYGEPDLAALAASYAWGLARNHAFTDGNKRTSFVVCLTFLSLNGAVFEASDAEKIETWLSLAQGALNEESLSAWLRARMKPGH